MSSEGGEQSAPGSRWNEWEPLDKWGEDSDPLDSGNPAGTPCEDASEWPTRPNSEQGEHTPEF